MNVLTEIPSLSSDEFVVDQYKSTLYPIPESVIEYVTKRLLPGNTVVLFSGEHRFNINATYIEPKFLLSMTRSSKNSKIIFADQHNTKLLYYTLDKLQIKNLLVLNNGHFIRYRDYQEIIVDMNNLKKYTDQLIVTLPLIRFDFNRLKYSNEEIAVNLGGTVLEETVVVCLLDC